MNDRLTYEIQKVAEVAGYLWQKGWAERNGGNISLAYGTFAAGTQGGWTAVPEPTSGLLMLLGMAGLALKRKRA